MDFEQQKGIVFYFIFLFLQKDESGKIGKHSGEGRSGEMRGGASVLRLVLRAHAS